jgi:hypothetical protein
VVICAAAFCLVGAGLVHQRHFAVLAVGLGVLCVLVAARESFGSTFDHREVPVSASLSTASLGTAFAAAHFSGGQAGICFAVLAALWGGLALVWAGKPEGRGLLVVSAITSGAGIGIGLADATSSLLSVTLAITGATWLTLAWRRRQFGWTLAGVASLAASWSVRLATLGVHVPEAYTLPVAVLLLVVARCGPGTARWSRAVNGTGRVRRTPPAPDARPRGKRPRHDCRPAASVAGTHRSRRVMSVCRRPRSA